MLQLLHVRNKGGINTDTLSACVHALDWNNEDRRSSIINLLRAAWIALFYQWECKTKPQSGLHAQKTRCAMKIHFINSALLSPRSAEGSCWLSSHSCGVTPFHKWIRFLITAPQQCYSSGNTGQELWEFTLRLYVFVMDIRKRSECFRRFYVF